jgi:hypothetical protein
MAQLAAGIEGRAEAAQGVDAVRLRALSAILKSYGERAQ